MLPKEKRIYFVPENPSHGSAIIAELERMGGKNTDCLTGELEGNYYYLDKDENIITRFAKPKGYDEWMLEIKISPK